MENKYILFLKEFLSFIRIETCFFVTGISVAGYAIFNEIGIGLLFLFLAVLLGTGANYGYNYLTDMKEDAVNNKSLNFFVLNPAVGRKLVVSLFAAGLFFSVFTSTASLAVYSALIALGIVYSGLRIKGMFIIKNLFTGLTISFAFLMGSAVSRAPDFEILSYIPFVFLFGMTLNILGDIRGYEGDMAAKVKTIPLVFGREAAKKIVYSITALFAVSAIISARVLLYPLIPFMLMISFFLHRNDHRKSRISILSSFVFFSVFMIILNLAGGI